MGNIDRSGNTYTALIVKEFGMISTGTTHLFRISNTNHCNTMTCKVPHDATHLTFLQHTQLTSDIDRVDLY